MRSTISKTCAAICVLALPFFVMSDGANAQQNEIQRIAAKSGETIELYPVWAQVNCRSTLLATPEVEVLEGPPELTFSVREQMVAAPATECHNKLKGGMVIVTVGDVKKSLEGKLTIRVKFKTKAQNGQRARTFYYSLFP
jgi:hypothetical protein